MCNLNLERIEDFKPCVAITYKSEFNGKRYVATKYNLRVGFYSFEKGIFYYPDKDIYNRDKTIVAKVVIEDFRKQPIKQIYTQLFEAMKQNKDIDMLNFSTLLNLMHRHIIDSGKGHTLAKVTKIKRKLLQEKINCKGMIANSKTKECK